jgi:signal transduction histidine kinase/ActR/RegA family two-component response regulator
VEPERPTSEHARLLEQRVLLLPPTQRDAEAIHDVFAHSGIACQTYESMPELCKALDDGAAAVVVSEEALSAEPERLFNYLGAQPVWADLPVIVLSRSGSESPKLTALLEKAGNVSVVERPVRISTFLSVVRVAIRGRARQYEVREHLEQIRAVEAERTALWESERTARAEAERAGRMKDEFLATLSHEIRTPLNAILGWTHLLGKGVRRDDELEKGLAVIERNAKAQSQIVADLLDMNRIVNGKLRLDVQRIRLAPVVQAAVDTIAPAADAKGIHLQVVLDPSTGPISGDPERLQQVFWNLLSNAVKFTPKGERIQVLLERVESHLEVRVVDTGEGIDAEFLPHVFDRFRQADGSTTRRHGGLGLGLAIVKQLVELHGGSVRATSPGRGKGATFVVVLPIAAVHAESSTAVERPHRTGGVDASVLASVDDIAGVKVLVVDDEMDSRDLVKRLLAGGGARVTTVGSAREALTWIRQEPPDVLISDIGMPGEDGYALMRQLRSPAVDSRGRIVAIALTAYARAEDRANAMRAGFQYHLSKPVEPSVLMAVVASAARRTAGP